MEGIEAESARADEHEPASGARDGPVLTRPFILLWVCGWAYFLGIGAVSPLLPQFVKNTLGASDAIVGLMVSLMAVSAVLTRPFAGRLANRWGRRRVATLGAVVAGASFSLYGIPSLATLAAARLLTGVGEALFFTAAATMVAELAPEHRRGEAVSYFSVAVYLGTGVGPAVGELAKSLWSIQIGFLTAVVFAAVSALVSLLLVETWTRAAQPAAGHVNKRISRLALFPGCVLGLGMISNVAFASFMPLYANQIHVGPAGVYLVYSAVVIVVRVFGARLPEILGPSRCGTLATLAIAGGMGTISLSGAAWGLYLGSAIMALGISFLYPSLMKLVVDRAPDAERAAAVATFTAFFDVASGFGGLAVGAVASAGGYEAAFSTAAASALVGLAVLQLAIVRPTPRHIEAR